MRKREIYFNVENYLSKLAEAFIRLLIIHCSKSVSPKSITKE
jgi:hypothetical protein